MTAMKKRVLFLCIHNSARSQMAEAFLKQIAGDRFEVESAGLEPGKLNPLAVEAMRHAGIDISRQRHAVGVRPVQERDGASSTSSACATRRRPSAARSFPGVTTRLNWNFADPSAFTGSEADRLAKTIAVRDEIRDKVSKWAHEEEAKQPLFGRAANR